jgi:hypothetical protein
MEIRGTPGQPTVALGETRRDMQPTFGMCIILVGGGLAAAEFDAPRPRAAWVSTQTATLKYHQGDTVAKTMTLVSEVGIGGEVAGWLSVHPDF